MRKLMRFFFYHFYHRLAWFYDPIAALVSVGRWHEWGRAALSFMRGPRILEIGFGTGHLQVEMNQLAFHAFGLDESRQMVSLARNTLAKNNYPQALTRGYAQCLPFASQSFDTVAACFPSEYIINPQTLSEIWRVLRVSGRLVIIPVASIGGRSLADQASNWLFRITGQTDQPANRLRSRLTPALMNAGFQVEVFNVAIRHSHVMIILAEKPN